MAIQDLGTRDQYVATSGQTIFPYTFEIFDKDDVTVEQNGTALTEGTHYTVSGVGVDAGGNITLVTGATTGDILTIYRDMALERLTDYQNSGDFLASDVNDDFDRVWAALQQNKNGADLAIRANTNDAILNATNTILAAPALRANKALGFTSTGAIDYFSGTMPVGTLRQYSTLAALQADITNTTIGDLAILEERTSGNGGGAKWKVIAKTTENGFDIVTGDATRSLQLIDGYEFNVLQYGAARTATDSINYGAIQRCFDKAGVTIGGIVNVGDGGFTVSEKLILTGIGTMVYSAKNRGTSNGFSIKLATASADTCLLNVQGSSCCLRGLTLDGGKTATTSGSYVIQAQEAFDGENNGNVDLFTDNCQFLNAETHIKISGRGYFSDNCDYSNMTNVLELDWAGTGFVAGPNSDQTLVTGFRSYRMSDCKFHAASNGFIVVNTGTYAANISGFNMSGCSSDATIRMWSGEMHDTTFDINAINMNSTSTALFNLTGGSNSKITGLYKGMNDNGLGVTREYINFANLTNCKGITFDVIAERINKDVFVIQSGCEDIKVRGIYKEFCLANATETRYPVRVTAAIEGLDVSATFRNSANLANDSYIIGNVGGVSITKSRRDGNMFDTSNWVLDNISEADNNDSSATQRKVIRYAGNGSDPQVFTLGFEPQVVIVNCLSGPDIDLTKTAVAISGTGSGFIDIVNNTVEVKSTMNTNTQIYTLIAWS